MRYVVLARSAPGGFIPLGFLARLPYAMTPLVSLSVIYPATHSYAFAGIAVGAQSLATAAGGIVIGSLARRVAPRTLGTTCAAVNAASFGGLLVACILGSELPILIAAVMTGLSQPQVGPLVRSRWAAVLSRRATVLDTAYAYESAADETSFVVGPLLVGLLALAPNLGTAGGTAVLGVIALLLLAALPFGRMYASTTGPAHVGGQPIPRMERWVRLGGLALGMVCVGAIFGSVQTAVTAYSQQTPGSPPAGVVYAVLAVGSAVAGVACAWIPARISMRARYVGFSATLCLAMGALLMLTVVGVSPLWGLLIAGLSIAPYMISLYGLAQRLAARSTVTLFMAVLSAGDPLGTAGGQGVAGVLVDAHGLQAAWALPLGFAGAGLLLAIWWFATSTSGGVGDPGASEAVDT